MGYKNAFRCSKNPLLAHGHFSACFELCNAVVNMFKSHSCRVGRFVELRNVEMLLEVLKCIGPDTAGRCT